MIVLIAHQKGGVGKSTIAVNLAAALQAQGRDSILVEADPTIHTVSNWANDRQAAGLEPVTASQLKGNLYAPLLDLAKRYDYVLVDVAGKDSRELRTAMTAADVVVTPMQASQADLDAAATLVATINEARDLNPGLKALAVLSRVSTHVFDDEAGEAGEYLQDYPELRVAAVKIYERKIYRTALAQGRGVVEMHDRKAKTEIEFLLEEIQGMGDRSLA